MAAYRTIVFFINRAKRKTWLKMMTLFPTRGSEKTRRIEELKELSGRHLARQFPREEWRRIAQMAGDNDEDFWPDINHYSFELWARCKGANRLQRGTREMIEDDLKYYAIPMQQCLAKYHRFFSLVSERDTPAMFAYLNELEEMRKMLLQVLTDYIS